jgi:hypothetical protein
MAQEVENLPHKSKALNSNSSTGKKNKIKIQGLGAELKW